MVIVVMVMLMIVHSLGVMTSWCLAMSADVCRCVISRMNGMNRATEIRRVNGAIECETWMSVLG